MKWGLITVSIENVLVEGFHVSLMALDRNNLLYKIKMSLTVSGLSGTLLASVSIQDTGGKVKPN